MKRFRDRFSDGGRRIRHFINRQAPYLLLTAFVFLFLLVYFFNSMVISIHPGELGVLWRRLGGGAVVQDVYQEGVHLILPINRMYIYNVRRQRVSDSIDVLTVDG